MKTNIRKGNESDIAIIAGFQIKMALETENLALDPKSVEKGVQYFFDHQGTGFYLIAESKDLVCGCLLVQNEWSDWRNCFVWWIHSVYVLPEYRKNGIFALMYNYLKEKVEQNEELGGLRLFVDKTNIRAQKVYEKMGMNGDHYLLYEWMIR